MFQKSHCFWCFLASQKEPRGSILVVFFDTFVSMFFDVSASDFLKNINFCLYTHGLVKVPFFNVFVIFHVFVFFVLVFF